MKTSKIIATLATLNLILFMSAASIANPYSRHTGDGVKTTVNKEINAAKGNITELNSSATSGNEFSYLRFDVNKFSCENESSESLTNSLSYLRFDASTFVTENAAQISELPVATEFEYLRFDVNNFTERIASNLNEMPVNEFEYLRFDVNSFTGMNTGEIGELPSAENTPSV